MNSYLSRVTMSDPACLVGHFSRVLQNRGGAQREHRRRGGEESECLGWARRMSDVDGRACMIRTSGRCRSTGSLLLSRAFRMSPIAMGDDSALIFCLASSSHAFTSALRASSPCPKSAVTLASGRGCASGVGRDSTDNDSASRVNPWVSTRGSASFKSLALETNASQPSRSATRKGPAPCGGHSYKWGKPRDCTF